jgi:uncharacterized protein YndB with AHSA1/START domain
MSFKDFYKREKHVVINAQSKNFRIAKWAVIILIAIVLYAWKGWFFVAILFVVCAVLGTTLHFFLRWKTEGWTKSWGPYKRIPLNGDMENNNELIVTKVFDAPCEVVWKAWTTPQLIARWFAPGIVMDVRELDVRPGGHFRFADPHEPKSGEYTGTYVVVEPLRELSFRVVDYSRADHPGGENAAFKVVFEALGEQTKITLTSIPPENSYHKETYDAWSGCFDRLAGVIK